MFVGLFVFSGFLMFKTFQHPGGNLRIAAKAWSDFAATIPLVRSFSLGANFPPEYPIFPGFPIKYHFVFFFLVGILEKLGIPLDWALNSLSTLSFFALTVAIYFLAKEVFKKRVVALLSVVLFLFNGSWSFVEFFKSHPLGANTLRDIVTNVEFSSFGPYDGKVVSAFWNLNIFTNQRHLGIAYAAFLILVLIIYQSSRNPKNLTVFKSFLLGIAIGIFPFIHSAVFGMAGIALLVFFLIYPSLRLKIFIMGAVALTLAIPQILYMGPSQVEFSYFHPGYLVLNPTLKNFANYWVLNLGLTALLAPLGFLFSDKTQRKLFVPFVMLFVIGNLFQFTPDMPTNHKFFNLFLIGANFFTADLLVRMWERGFPFKLVVSIFILFLTLSGVIDFFSIANDRYVEILDIPVNPAAMFVLEKTPTDSIILPSSFLYDPASLAGRKIYLGWPYFSWGAGYDTTARAGLMQRMLTPKDPATFCSLIAKENIDFVEIQRPTLLPDTVVDYSFFEDNLHRVYFDPTTNFSIYDPVPFCSKLRDKFY